MTPDILQQAHTPVPTQSHTFLMHRFRSGFLDRTHHQHHTQDVIHRMWGVDTKIFIYCCKGPCIFSQLQHKPHTSCARASAQYLQSRGDFCGTELTLLELEDTICVFYFYKTARILRFLHELHVDDLVNIYFRDFEKT